MPSSPTLRGRRAATAVGAATVAAVLCVATGGSAQTLVGYSATVLGVRSTYDTERYQSFYVFNGVDLATGPVRVAVSVPLIRQHVTPRDDVVPATSAERTDTGFGDPLIRMDLRVVDDRRHLLQVSVAGSVKPAMVDPADGLGTGATDYGFGMSVFKVMGRASLLADALYWKYGDPEGVDFEDSMSFSVGIGRTMGGDRWSALASVAGFSPVSGLPMPVFLTFGAMRLVGRNQSLGVTAGLGLTDTSSDFSIGLSWRIQN